jgi:hypothetical protein
MAVDTHPLQGEITRPHSAVSAQIEQVHDHAGRFERLACGGDQTEGRIVEGDLRLSCRAAASAMA